MKKIAKFLSFILPWNWDFEESTNHKLLLSSKILYLFIMAQLFKDLIRDHGVFFRFCLFFAIFVVIFSTITTLERLFKKV